MKKRLPFFLCLLLLALTHDAAVGSAQDVVSVYQNAPTLDEATYLPLIGNMVDLWIERVEVTQAIQTNNNDVPLVAGRSTMIRIYAAGSESTPFEDVQVSVAALQGGSPLPHSPILITDQSIYPNPSPGNLSSTVNLTLPNEWLSGQVEIQVSVDPGNTIKEANENNNSETITINFSEVPPLDLMIVPIDYTDTSTGNYCPGPAEETITDWLMRTYPLEEIQVSFHAPMAYTGQVTNWGAALDLLNQLTALKNSDGAPGSQVYFGLIPESTADGNEECDSSNYMAWIGNRVTFGPEYNGRLAAHEIGHTFGRQHVDCGGPAYPDPAYPYANGSIGYYGVDVLANELIAPGETKDFMSYCKPQWVSDYTYRGLYIDQIANGEAAVNRPVQKSLLFRAVLNEGENFPAASARILPLYVVNTSPTKEAESDEFILEFIGSDGQNLSRQAVPLFHAEENGLEAKAIHAVVPLPDGEISRLRLLHEGRPIAERVLEDSAGEFNRVELSVVQETITLEGMDPTIPFLVTFNNLDRGIRETLALDVTGGKWSIESSSLPAGSGFFEIVFSDRIGSKQLLWMSQ